jgi:hypothetical protein
MTRACANSTSEAKARWLNRIRDPYYSPPRYEPKLKKEPGSLSLVCGEWIEER